MTDTRIAGGGPASINWQHWANAIVAIWLFISPWVLQFGSAAAPAGEAAGGGEAAGAAGAGGAITASWNAWILAILIFIVAVSNLGRMDFRQGWINLVLGAWVFISPWVLSYANLWTASWNAWIVGAIVFLLSAWLIATARSTAATIDAAHHRP